MTAATPPAPASSPSSSSSSQSPSPSAPVTSSPAQTSTGSAGAPRGGTGDETPVLRMRGVGKSYGRISALRDIDMTVRRGEVTCVLGDNGAGKSTLIKIMAGLHEHDTGEMLLEGEARHFGSPREALARGIATVYQDLALAPLMSVWRNFFLGNEITRAPFGRLDVDAMKRICGEELDKIGIPIADLDRPVGALSGGQKQCIAIARAIYFGAKVIILDEPTAALGVTQSGVVLRYVAAARDAGLGVVFITHNPHHAYLVGDHFVVLKLGEVALDARRDEIGIDRLTAEMAGGRELEALSHELARAGSPSAPDAGSVVADPVATESDTAGGDTTGREAQAGVAPDSEVTREAAAGR